MNNISEVPAQKKEYLQSYNSIILSINIVKNLINHLEVEHERYSFILKDINNKDKYDIEIKNLILSLFNLLSKKNQICETILSKINQMDIEVEKNILTLKYISGHTWEQISEIMNYSLRQVYNIHNNALQHFDK